MTFRDVRVLVAIANHGTGNRQYLEQVLTAYREMPIDVSIVVLSNIPKYIVPDVEVRIGVPSDNPWSLPFAHRTLFRERIDEYDFFIYSEDDTLLRWTTLESFIKSMDILSLNEIAGFLRIEKSPEGTIYYSTCHNFFRWIPSSVRRRGEHLWAKYSNEHSACFVASKEQIRNAIESGGFPAEPHEGRFDMLCTAATDLYTRCGFDRLICIDRMNDFTLQHIPNKYIGHMGLPEKEVEWQIEALRLIYAGRLPDTEMFNPETKLPGAYGSKRLREDPDPVLKAILRDEKGLVISWGAGDGHAEADLLEPYREVGVVAFNWIMAQCCRKRGLVVFGAGDVSLQPSEVRADVIVITDVVHLLSDPFQSLSIIRTWLKPNGQIIVRVPNFRNIQMLKRRFKKSSWRVPLTWEGAGLHAYMPAELDRLLRKAGFKEIEVVTPVMNNRFGQINRFSFGLFSTKFSPYLYAMGRKD